MPKWKSGDIVRLKSGGPTMTVDRYVQGFGGTPTSDVIAKWFSSKGQETGSFHEDSLEKAPEIK